MSVGGPVDGGVLASPSTDRHLLFPFPELRLDEVALRASEDCAKTDLEVVCERCDEHLCDAEAGNTLAVLVSVAHHHRCEPVDDVARS